MAEAQVRILVPSMLRDCCDGARDIPVSAPTVRAALARLQELHPRLYRNVCDETGAVRRHVNLYVNTDHIRDLAGLDTALGPGDEVSILPAVSGG